MDKYWAKCLIALGLSGILLLQPSWAQKPGDKFATEAAKPVIIAHNPTFLADLLNTTNACKAGPASMAAMPKWSEVRQKNRAYFSFLGTSNPNPYPQTSPAVGVPDLDNPANNITVGDSVRNIVSLFSNAVKVINTAYQIPYTQPANGKLGIGICKEVGTTQGRVLINPALTYCDYVTKCGAQTPTMSTFLWIPEDLDFLHSISFTIAGFAVEPWTFVEDTNVTFPSPSTTATGYKRWTLQLIDVIDTWNSTKLNNFKDGFASILSGADKKYTNWWAGFEKGIKASEAMVNRYVEGYHLGAYDEMRPDLHTCVGYYGHQTDNSAVELFDGRLNMGSSYNSFNLSKALRAQMRTGGMELEFVNKKSGKITNLPLLPTPEFNIQYDGLKSWDCDGPFGTTLSFCPTSAFTLPDVSVQGHCKTANYLSFENLGEGSGKLQVGGMKDFYPISLGNGVAWPRLDPSNEPQDGKWNEENVMPDELPSTAVASAGLNLGFDFTLPDPHPQTLARFTIGPVPAVLQWDLDYGVRWVHDSNFVLERIKSAVTKSGTAAPVSTLLERNMHPLQADDLTADNGQELYVKPSLILGAGLSISRKYFGLEALIKMGLHVDVEPGFYAGLADMSLAMKDAVEALGNVNGVCEPVYAEKLIEGATLCTADVFAEENLPHKSALDKLAALRDGSSPAPLMTTTDVIYYCGEKPKFNAKTEGTPTLLGCASRGYCTSSTGKRTKQGVEKSACKPWDPKTSPRGGDFETFTPYSCAKSEKTDIVGWKGPGCSPLLEGAGFPTAPGGVCKDTSFQPKLKSDPKRSAVSPPTLVKPIEILKACSSGTTCVKGACATQCTTNAQCTAGYTCDSQTKACVNSAGIPFIEQILWQKDHPAPGEPLHSVWTHAVNTLEAKVDFSLGVSLKAWIKIFRRQIEVANVNETKYWNLASQGWADYAIGMSADYANSCDASVGNVEVNQSHLPRISSGQFANSKAMVAACLNKLPEDVLPASGPPCQPGETPNANGVCGLPNDDNIGNGIEAGLAWSEEVALGMWDEYEGQMCINGLPWKAWIERTTSKRPGDTIGVPILADGVLVGTISEGGQGMADIERKIALASGCLAPNAAPFGSQMAAVAGLDSGGNIQLFNHLQNPTDGAVPWNIKPPVSSAQGFPVWYDAAEQCLSRYVSGEAGKPGHVTIGLEMAPCRGVKATAINMASPNRPVSGPLKTTPVTLPQARPPRR